MLTKWLRCLTVALLAASLALAIAAPSALAQQRTRYFPQTGFSVSGEFLDFWETRGGLDIFGYPIGSPISEDGRTVQYFQRARMELHPENPAAYRVQLGRLGALLYGPPAPPVPADRVPRANDPHARYFSETGQVVSWAFLDFWRARGGLDIFGNPLSPEMTEKGATVQYFERARLEWHPENADPYKVQVGLLGAEWRALHPAASPTPAPTPVLPQPTSPVLTATQAPTPARTPVPTAAATTVPSRTAAPTAAPTVVPAAVPTAAPPSSSPMQPAVALVAAITAVLIIAGIGGYLWWKRDAWLDWLRTRRQGAAAQAAPTLNLYGDDSVVPPEDLFPREESDGPDTDEVPDGDDTTPRPAGRAPGA